MCNRERLMDAFVYPLKTVSLLSSSTTTPSSSFNQEKNSSAVKALSDMIMGNLGMCKQCNADRMQKQIVNVNCLFLPPEVSNLRTHPTSLGKLEFIGYVAIVHCPTHSLNCYLLCFPFPSWICTQ